MARILAVAFVGAVLASASGCKQSADSLIKEMIAGLNSLAESIEKGEPEAKQKAIAEKLKATKEKMDKMKLTKEQDDALKEKYKDEVTKAMMRLLAAGMKAEKSGAKMPDLGGLFK